MKAKEQKFKKSLFDLPSHLPPPAEDALRTTYKPHCEVLEQAHYWIWESCSQSFYRCETHEMR